MTSLFPTTPDALALVLRLTAFFAAGEALLWISRRLPAPQRHTLCALTLGGSLLLPWLAFAATRFSPVTPAFVLRFQSWPTANMLGPAPLFSGLSVFWFAGVCALLLRTALGLWHLARQTQAASPLTTDGWAAALQEAATTLGVNAASLTLKAANVPAPLVWGYVRPTILLPHDAAQWDFERRRLVLLHELAHVQRRDLWTNLLRTVATALYWFHPLAWHLAAKLTAAQEQACDAVVVQAGSDPQAYAALLVSTVREGHHALLGACPMTRGLSELRQRLQLVLTPASARRRFWQSALVPALASVLLLTGALHPIHAQNTPPYKIGGDIKPPRLLVKQEPAYTTAARDAKIEGEVLLSVIIDESGHIRSVQVTRSLDPGLDTNAIAAVQQWQFAPATLHDKPVAVKATIEVQFRLL